MADLAGELVTAVGTLLMGVAAIVGLRKHGTSDELQIRRELEKDRDYWHDRAREGELATGWSPTDMPAPPRRGRGRR